MKALKILKPDGVRPATESQVSDDVFYKKVANLLIDARRYAKKQLDATIISTYYEVGRQIFQREQEGEHRARYGKMLLQGLSEYLVNNVDKRFSSDNLKLMRRFYMVYSGAIAGAEIGESLIPQFTPNVTWSHYLQLMRIDNPAKRRFYELETAANGWTIRQLQRQYNSSLYERLALSRNKEKVLELANAGQVVEKPEDIFKTPYVFEFTGLKEETDYSESELEQALINKLSHFLLELGKGFLFEARQKRFTYNEDHYFVDLVFYNRLLQCYVIFDLKNDKLTHQDLGQMQMYVHYFDRCVKKEFEKPTIGILLCREHNSSVVEMTLPRDSNIYAAAYSLYLPDKSLLQQKLAEWVAEFEEEHGGQKQ